LADLFVIHHPLSALSDAKSDRRAEPAVPQCLADLARVMSGRGARLR
jgi:hypothetical protein